MHSLRCHKLQLDLPVFAVKILSFFKFSASAGYKQVHKGSSEYRRSYVSSKAKCLLYHASIERLTASRVTDQFFKAVMSLPTKQNDEQYISFINAFGTHYASALDMGAKAVLRSEFESTAWSKLDSQNFNFKAAAHASFFVFAGGLKVSTEKAKQLAASFDSNRSSVVVSYMGCRPSSDGKWETWLTNSELSPYPISYDLRPITELLTPQFFPNVSEKDLATRQAILNATYEIYCHNIPGCGQPEADRVPVKMDRPEAAIIGVRNVSCRPGLSLLSCGLSNLPFAVAAESNRYAVPVDSTTCECFANNGAVCQPWCTNKVNDLEKKVSEFARGDFRVDCPKGKKVIRFSSHNTS
jgi:MAC/Perforin domain